MPDSPTTDPAVSPARPAPTALPPDPAGEIRAGGLLRRLEAAGQLLDRAIHRFLPPALNPFSQLGALANTCFLIALGSGILLLLWYSPSVHQAWGSLDALGRHSPGALVRSLHRYSSDACVLLILLHAIRMFLARRFAGPRWLAWTSGIALLALVWFIGWTGYWLVWDVAAGHAARGTARFIDRLPFFTEPMSRSFLTNASVPSLLFFLIFFTHMLAPLGVGIALWIHLQRVNRARLLTGRALTLATAGSLAVVSVLFPAVSGPAADMLGKAERFDIDAWFLWPLLLTDRLGGGMLWLIFLGAGVVTMTIPWWMVRRRRPVAEVAAGVPEAPGVLERRAVVDLPRCFGCTLCATDCPFNAITMIPRTDGRKPEVESSVDPDLCIGCGICTGSCDSEAINLPVFSSRDLGPVLQAWIRSEVAAGRPAWVVFACGESAGHGVGVDASGRSAELSGYRVQEVPCVGWISAVLLERTLQAGASGVLVVACGEGDANCREGARWFADRLDGRREPAFDPRKADRSKVRMVHLDRTRRRELPAVVRAFQAGVDPAGSEPPRGGRRWAAGLALAAGLAAVTVWLSAVPYHPPHASRPELVVSFNHRGDRVTRQALSAEDAAKRLPHMRNQANLTRERAPVRMRVRVDEAVIHEGVYPGKGLSRDGPSVALLRFDVPEGGHRLVVEFGDTPDAEAWPHRWEATVEFVPGRTAVLLFETKAGFTWHAAGGTP